ncbi:unnamed protein product [Diamesa serratosioi]
MQDIISSEVDNIDKAAFINKHIGIGERCRRLNGKFYQDFQWRLEELNSHKKELIELIGEYNFGTKVAGCIEMIFEAAVTNPDNIPIYAELCQTMSMINERETDTVELCPFNRCLIEKCLMELEINCVAAVRMRRRSLTTIKFLGSVFNLGLVPNEIIHSCLFSLMFPKYVHDVTLECYCKLLKIIGAKLKPLKKQKTEKFYVKKLKTALNKNSINISAIQYDLINKIYDLENNKLKYR